MIAKRAQRLTVVSLIVAAVLASALPTRGQTPVVEAVLTRPESGLPRALPNEMGVSAEVLARLRPAMQMHVDTGWVPGILVAVARHGKLVYLETIGSADVARGTPLLHDAVFRIYSMSKPVTAVAVMQLVEQGRLSLDDELAKYIPAWANARVYNGGGTASPVTVPAEKRITIRDLLMHTSGIAYGISSTPADSLVNAWGIFHGGRSLEVFADSLATIPLAVQPGSRWRYAAGLEVLGRVIEVVTHRPFEQYLKEEVFQPLGMTSTGFRLTPELAARAVVMHERGADGRLRAATTVLAGDNFIPGARFACGGCGLVSTAGDYLRFAQMLLNGGELDGVRVLRPETVAMMTRNLLPDGMVPIASYYGPGMGQGLGMAVKVHEPSERGPAPPGVAGWSGAANTFFWIDPAANLVGMVWTQHVTFFGATLGSEVQRIVYEALHR
jgi:CubicO group peptidase (beta-lactamase class C family)